MVGKTKRSAEIVMLQLTPTVSVKINRDLIFSWITFSLPENIYFTGSTVNFSSREFKY